MKSELKEIMCGAVMALFTCFALVTTTAIVGCDNKEKVLDVETPNRSIEVEKDKDTGDTKVEVERKTD